MQEFVKFRCGNATRLAALCWNTTEKEKNVSTEVFLLLNRNSQIYFAKRPKNLQGVYTKFLTLLALAARSRSSDFMKIIHIRFIYEENRV